ncbi:unnamed protein product [Effrenium voratum]|uniref:C3H1-type domain-containing protein n=1 Tax=Effrenium voratum TaxID=2562239 RepID=A0AA36IPA7_9DINO|nr:unnamed protein product [Effrenium voratum]
MLATNVWPNRSILGTVDRLGKLYVVLVKNSSLNIEPWPPMLPRSRSCPALSVVQPEDDRGCEEPAEQLLSDAAVARLRHAGGQCLPCIFFHSKADGCRNGDRCSHCHICTVADMKHKKNFLKRQAKRRR